MTGLVVRTTASITYAMAGFGWSELSLAIMTLRLRRVAQRSAFLER